MRRIVRSRGCTAWRSVGAALALALGTAGCASDEEKVAQHVAAAEELLEAGDHRAALVELRSALSLQPKNAELNLKIADAYQSMGAGQAAFYYGEAYRLDKSLTRAALMQVPSLYVNDVEEADALVDEVIEREPSNVDAWTRRAEVRLIDNDAEGALAAALTAVELDPAHIGARRMVTSVYRAMIREALLRGGGPENAPFEEALAAADAAAKASEGEERLGPWFDQKEKALIYAEWEGHQDEAEGAIREAYRLAAEAEDEIGLDVVTEHVRQLAYQHPDAEFRRWALEKWVENDPEAVKGWRRLAALERELGGSSDDVWERALSERPDDVALHAEYARVLAATESNESAMAYLDSLPAAVGTSAELMAIALEMQLVEGDLEAARLRLERLQAEHPDAPVTQLAEAVYLSRTGNRRAALEKLRALAGRVERADVLRQLAVAEASAGNPDAALGALERAIQLQPTGSPEAHYLRLRLLAGKGDWLGVLRGWRDMRQLSLRPDAFSNSLRIQALYELGRREAAWPLLEASLQREGGVTNQEILLFHRYESAHQPDRVQRVVREAWEESPEDVALTRALMTQALARQDRPEALRVLEKHEEITGTSAAPVMHARILFVSGREEEAERLAIAAFETRPRPFGASPLLTEILGARGKTDVAIEMLEASRREGTLQPAGLWQLGRLYYELREFEKALGPLEEAHEANPDFSPATSDLALVLAELGRDLDRAVSLARRVKSQNPENSGIADTLGYVYLKKGLAEPAAFEFRSAIELARVRGREVAEYHYHLGLALRAQGRDAEAGQAFAEALRIEPEHQAAREAAAS